MLALPILPNPMASQRNAYYEFEQSPAYAVPIQREPRRSDSYGANLSYAQHELLRRRKTPYGRMEEEQEAATLDRTVQLPATKHVLLSRSPPHNEMNAFDHKPMANRSRSYTSQMGQMGVDNYQPRRIDLHPPAWDFPGGVDSVLHQTLPTQTTKYYHHPGSHVPTVLPTALHAHLGPTASAGQEYYGPYWPDGTFSPYRPAPIRDGRFFERTPPMANYDYASNPDQRSLRRPGRLPSAGNFNMGYETYPYTPRPSQMTGNVADVHNGRWLSSPTAFSQEPLMYAAEPELAGQQSSQQSSHPRLAAGHASDRIAFRDRSFTWAHQIYVDLLSRIQREGKTRVTNQYGHTRAVSKPAIYPRPPQRTGSHFKESRSILTPDDTLLNRPQTAVRRGSEQTVPTLSRFPADGGTTGVAIPQGYRGHRRGSDPSTSYDNEYAHIQLAPPTAFTALDTMELLCREAETPWTDGMLLAGCLAYGLGNYAKAAGWYQEIIQQDPKHVEAMSNLAATLLALGKREEALQHWSAAIKLRPGYFEAVEHLIGLLCSTHRAREAVNIIDYVESCLRQPTSGYDTFSDGESDTQSRASSTATMASMDNGLYDYEVERRFSSSSVQSAQQSPGYGTSGFLIPGSDNGRLLALIHAKGNMLYALGDNAGAAASFEDAILIATGHRSSGIDGLIRKILRSCISSTDPSSQFLLQPHCKEPILLAPDRAQQTAARMFAANGELPGLEFVVSSMAKKAAISTTSNSLLSLAKIYQDGMSNPNSNLARTTGTREILALYYLSLSLQRSPSTANNVGILLAGVQQTTHIQTVTHVVGSDILNQTGIAPGSGIGLAFQYYNYGLNIDPRHAHLYTNLGSLLKDLGQLGSAIKMYTKAVEFDPKFDIALANLANAVKDQGRIADAIIFYRRAVQANPDFAEAVCGLATALNSVCNWYGRGGVYGDYGKRDRYHVDDYGQLHEARKGFGWINRVIEIVDKQLKDGENWGIGTLTSVSMQQLCQSLSNIKGHLPEEAQAVFQQRLKNALLDWRGKRWEGARVVRLVERAIRYIGWQWYQDLYKSRRNFPMDRYARPKLPTALTSPTAPTVLPFHTFTTPLSAKQVRQISQRNALRISVSTLRSPWLPATVYPPPRPPAPFLKVGYVSSDFNNHPLAHLMQSVFGLHDLSRVKAYCYATTGSDNSIHRQQIEREAPAFHDVSTWSVERLVQQVVDDGIHVLVNLNGYTRGARNEVFAARPAPIHMSFMGFAGTLGAEWCDYVFADSISVSEKTLAPWRRNVEIEDRLEPKVLVEDAEDWMYAENVIFAKSTFFCVDHKQSAPDAKVGPPHLSDPVGRERAWRFEQQRRWRLRKELFPDLPDHWVILGNFNQLYKIDPATFRLYLRILAAVPNSILWLLRFPDVGEQNLMTFAHEWAGTNIAQRVRFTDVAPKDQHITRASVVDLFLDTPECNAHTTAADVIWSGTPIVTWARWDYKMCSRMASSIVASALPEGPIGDKARAELLVNSEDEYEKQAICLASGLQYSTNNIDGQGNGRLMDIRRTLWEGRWTSRLFDTKRWVKNLETAYWQAWRNWESGKGGDIWL